MLQAMNTGHDGSLSTVHSNSARDALARIETMVLMAGFELPIKAIRQQVASAIDLVIHLERMPDGSRKVVSISEVQRMEGDVITMQELFAYSTDYDPAADESHSHLRPTRLQPGFMHKIIQKGVHLPPSMRLAGIAHTEYSDYGEVPISNGHDAGLANGSRR
jgi:pilus assembly protein CpaF